MCIRDRSGKFELLAWADASFAQDLVKRRSTTGYLFLFGGAPVSYYAVVQLLSTPKIALSPQTVKK